MLLGNVRRKLLRRTYCGGFAGKQKLANGPRRAGRHWRTRERRRTREGEAVREGEAEGRGCLNYRQILGGRNKTRHSYLSTQSDVFDIAACGAGRKCNARGTAFRCA